jgi:hypothetical protein
MAVRIANVGRVMVSLRKSMGRLNMGFHPAGFKREWGEMPLDYGTRKSAAIITAWRTGDNSPAV